MSHSTKVDNFPLDPKKNTKATSLTGYNTFNWWWHSFQLDPNLHGNLYILKQQYAPSEEGMVCLASMLHEERALVLAHFVHKVKSR